jgi:hypothetical protein
METEFDRIEREFEQLEPPADESPRDLDDGPPDGGPAEGPKGDPTSPEGNIEAPSDGFTAEDSADMLDEELAFPPRTATEALVDAKLEQVKALRNTGAIDEARRLLYEILTDGNTIQVKVARNILEQLDS